jgi:hypothetical protein
MRQPWKATRPLSTVRLLCRLTSCTSQKATPGCRSKLINFSFRLIHSFAGYIGFSAFVLLLIMNRHLCYGKSANAIRSSSFKRWLDVHWIESPLVTLRHHVPIPLPGLSRLTIQAPLRYEAVMICIIIICNILPLCLFYRVVPGDRNVL